MTGKKEKGHEGHAHSHGDQAHAIAMQQQVQVLMAQKEALDMQLLELNKALEELEKTKETEVYRLSGPILIKSSKAETKKDLEEKQKAVQDRLEIIDRNAKRILQKKPEEDDEVVKSSDHKIKVGG
jgi:prefoldin beta subunit